MLKLKSCPLLLPYIAHVINPCISTSTFPDCSTINHQTNFKSQLFICSIRFASYKHYAGSLKSFWEESLFSWAVIWKRMKFYLAQFGFRVRYCCSVTLLDVCNDKFRATDICKFWFCRTTVWISMRLTILFLFWH